MYISNVVFKSNDNRVLIGLDLNSDFNNISTEAFSNVLKKK